jgi:hypothetical protein
MNDITITVLDPRGAAYCRKQEFKNSALDMDQAISIAFTMGSINRRNVPGQQRNRITASAFVQIDFVSDTGELDLNGNKIYRQKVINFQLQPIDETHFVR